jgi:hypothetical protein
MSIESDSRVPAPERQAIQEFQIRFRNNDGYPNSITHYYHFLFSALFPLVEHHLNNPKSLYRIKTDIVRVYMKNIFVVNIYFVMKGPLKGLLLELPLNIIELRAEKTTSTRNVGEITLPGYDNFNRDLFEEPCVQHFKKIVVHPVLQFFRETIPRYIEALPTYQVLLIERATESYFKDVNNAADPALWTSGKQRRSISNHSDLAAALTATFGERFKNISLERMSIYYQYVLFNTADIVIAQHGGGLSNIVFMRPEAAVIEFSPPWGRDSNHFLNLAAFMGVEYTRLLQSSDHGPVNIEEAVRTVDAILKRK